MECLVSKQIQVNRDTLLRALFQQQGPGFNRKTCNALGLFKFLKQK